MSAQIISIGVKLSTAQQVIDIAETYDHIYCSVGIHPHEAGNEPLSCDIEAITALASHPKCVAIGEAGLDYYYDNAPRDATGGKPQGTNHSSPRLRSTYYYPCQRCRYGYGRYPRR